MFFSRPGQEHSSGRGKSAEFLIQELALTPKQQDEFGQLSDFHREKLFIIQDKDKKLHDRFFDALFQPNPDTITVRILSDSIASLRKQGNAPPQTTPFEIKAANQIAEELGQTEIQILKEMILHDQALRNLLTPDQQVQFDARPKPFLHMKRRE